MSVCDMEGVYPTANYRPLIPSAVTATLFLHVNDSQMGPHILPPARTKLPLKETERKRRMPLLVPAGVGSVAEGTESCP